MVLVRGLHVSLKGRAAGCFYRILNELTLSGIGSIARHNFFFFHLTVQGILCSEASAEGTGSGNCRSSAGVPPVTLTELNSLRAEKEIDGEEFLPMFAN